MYEPCARNTRLPGDTYPEACNDPAAGSAAMKARPTHIEEILRDDIDWLQSRIRQLQASNDVNERKRASCYERLLAQRQRQLASGSSEDDICPGCWQEYLC